MLTADVGIIGGGLAGSIAAAMLGRAGISAVLIDPDQTYPPDFRCEKLDASQVALLHRTGLAPSILGRATPIDELWVARGGHLLDRRRNHQFGIAYGDLVNAAREQIPAQVRIIHAKASALMTGDAQQTIVLSAGAAITVRCIVLASGLNNGIRQALGIWRTDVSPCHSISVGWDMVPRGRERFDFPALTYFGERPSTQIGYVTFFPIGSTMRANLFVYRDRRDPWLRAFRERPQETLFGGMPRLRALLGDFDVTSRIEVRPVDLYVTNGYRQPGVALAGDAFATSCPAAGTGLNKVLTDIERLCNIHLPGWLATPGMGVEKIGAFYDDPAKVACDMQSAQLAFYMRSLAIARGPAWRFRRIGWMAMELAKANLHRLRGRRVKDRTTLASNDPIMKGSVACSAAAAAEERVGA